MNRWRVVGVLSGAAGLAAAELIAAFVRPSASPYLAVGDAVVDLTPQPVKDLAISLLGPADKVVLLGGIAVLLVGFAAYVGQLGGRRLGYGLGGIGLLTAIGVLAAVTRPDAGPGDALPAIGGGFVAALTLRGLAGMPAVAHLGTDDADTTQEPAGPDRRRFLVTGGLIVAGAGSATAISRWLGYQRFGAARSRAAVTLPSPRSAAAPVPRDPAVDIRGLSRFHTPTDDFYRVDTALTVPQIPAEEWDLRIGGMVRRPLRLTYDDLLRRPLIERDITLACVSNPVGGPYVGNARWLGVPLKDLLEEVDVDPDADQAVSRSHDGMTIGTPTAALTDGRDAMLAVGMNGEPLPLRHGFPVRMVVPGLYGYVSACKWIVEIELTTFREYDAYWIKQGWAEQAEVKTASRIDAPRDGATVKPGLVYVAGVAWAQHRGIERVEVRIDDEPWRDAELAPAASLDTWRQWFLRWRAEPGEHRIRVRATDGAGRRQTGRAQGSFPDGATGWHAVDVTVLG